MSKVTFLRSMKQFCTCGHEQAARTFQWLVSIIHLPIVVRSQWCRGVLINLLQYDSIISGLSITVFYIIHRPAYTTFLRLLDSVSVKWNLLKRAQEKELVSIFRHHQVFARRQRLALSIGRLWARSIWRPRKNIVSETSRFEIEDRTVENVQNFDSYNNIPSSQTYG
jgi:hypothetical protein